MSQGFTASNLSDHGSSPRAAGGNVGGGRRRGGGPPRSINFTITFDNVLESISLSETSNVDYLQKVIETRLKIPVSKQFLYGWPVDEPTNKNQSFKDMKLPVDTLLYLAVEGPLEECFQLEVVEEDNAPGTSSSSRTSCDVKVEHFDQDNVTYDFTVHDLKNKEHYTDVSFKAYQTVEDVKVLFGDITCIPFKDQEWSGWPDGAQDRDMLKDIGLDTPKHTLTLSERKHKRSRPVIPSVSVSPVASQTVQIEEASSTVVITTPASSPTPVDVEVEVKVEPSVPETTARSNDELPLTDKSKCSTTVTPIRPGPSSEIRRVARKSTSKGALRHFQAQRAAARQGPTSPPVASHQNQSVPVSIDSPSPERRKRNVSERSGPNSSPKKFKLDESPTASQKSPKKMKECHLFKLPQDIVKKLLEYLDPISELSLRRTCKATKEWVERDAASITLTDEQKWERFRLTITGKEHKTFETAAKMSLPITSFIFDVQDFTFYETGGVDVFIGYLSLRVRKLRLRKFFMFENPGEHALMSSFHKIEELTLDELVITDSGKAVQCPVSLKNLESLKLNYLVDIPRHGVLIRPKSWNMTWGMLMDCDRLLYFRFPRLNEENVKDPIQDGDGVFAPLLEYIQMKNQRKMIPLGCLDLKHFNNTESYYVTRFVSLLGKCHNREIRLKNVNALVVQQVLDDDFGFGDEKFKFGESIISLVNYGPFVENAPMSNLEKLKIDIMPSVRDYSTMGRAYKDIFWPKLKTIKVIDSFRTQKNAILKANWQIVQEDLYGQNGSFDRRSVEYIKIYSPTLPYFLGEGKLAQKFVNLKKLDISAWYSEDSPGVLNKRLWPIWNRLRLEELSIANCPKLNDNSFIGKAEIPSDEENDEDSSSSGDSDIAYSPPFLAMRQSLKKFTLHLDGVTRVTDKSFKTVFSWMKFHTFILLSNEPTQISEAALLKLKNGSFGKYIERFPFDCWSTTKIDAARFERIGKQFRSRR